MRFPRPRVCHVGPKYTSQMLFNWSAECSADDPVLVVPWSSDSSSDSDSDQSISSPTSHFIDLRDDSNAAEDIPEAEGHPPLIQALRALNAPRSSLFTAKCDAWTIDDPAELETLRLDLDLPEADAATGFASYIDLLWRDRTIFASFHQHEHLVHRLARRAAPADHTFALLDCVIRPALLDLAGPQEGFALTLYVKALGPNEPLALASWSSALETAVAILRSKDLTPNT